MKFTNKDNNIIKYCMKDWRQSREELKENRMNKI